ncbi:hypothetical protein SAMN05892883_3532 [Jatrophihabitans sp. GAS493]|uniref:hypothetical protein n=1 Tax=Jatrophihabitans sp. GAS493 TaxID=1907575 RepID=UPI000BBF3CD8|nr:hypothetical protein [Jatrophihabitans sp. GAS493]SOD74348.1 hypothetical protein SAMN05892883_3532 [Jatrophihabitans sp. GAS493]
MTERAAPFYCPYCGDEDLRPFGEKHGEWRCGSCRRVYRLGYIGIARDWTDDVQPDRPIEDRTDAAPTSSEEGQ